MGDRWLPWSAASLASGAVLLVLGSFALPRARDAADLLESVQTDDSLWMMAAVAYFLAAVGLTLGLPAIYSLLPPRHSVVGMVGLWVWSFGTIGAAGLASMLVLFQPVIQDLQPTSEQVEALVADQGITIWLLGIAGAFYVGEVVVALVLLRGRTVGRWVPVLMLAHVVLGLLGQRLPDIVQSLESIVLGVALMGLAVRASEKWTDVRAHPGL